jgi:hypothetical protein
VKVVAETVSISEAQIKWQSLGDEEVSMASDCLSVSMTTCATINIESNARIQDRGEEFVDERCTSDRASRQCNGRHHVGGLCSAS